MSEKDEIQFGGYIHFYIKGNDVSNEKFNLTAWTSFYGFYGMPFAKIFSTDGIAPSEKSLVSLDDYVAIRGGSYSEVENTLENAVEIMNEHILIDEKNLVTQKPINKKPTKTPVKNLQIA